MKGYRHNINMCIYFSCSMFLFYNAEFDVTLEKKKNYFIRNCIKIEVIFVFTIGCSRVTH